ncbi:MAG: TlpA family protein disulfide reductase [Xanthomonadaceae bacterium]|nr:TlpA family protein disulfide reductase [Xanthomonadaceae bacterium]MDE2178833.1 TlpA family protein disulfide reductase [Xanthomonadaceae bacterium]MDE2245452.1 TlpA family protein disulfide reductase [Xanthomonadaceae bacterium]
MDRKALLLVLGLAVLAGLGGLFAGRWWSLRLPSPPRSVSVLGIGDRADALILPDLRGRPTPLARWQGRLVLLNFWASWCGPCREEMPALAQAQATYATRGFSVIGIAMDEPAAVKAYLAQVPVDYPVLIGLDASPDPSLRFGDTRGALPYSVLIGRDGLILRTKLGAFAPGELQRWIERAL